MSTSAPDGQAPEPAPAPDTAEPASGPEDRSQRPQTFDETYVKDLRAEAAGYRRELREAQTERDQLRERVERQDREAVERLAGERLQSSSDFWLAVELADLRGDDGAIDREKVQAALEQVATDRPHWIKPPYTAFDGGVRGRAVSPAPSFGEALKGRSA